MARIEQLDCSMYGEYLQQKYSSCSKQEEISKYADDPNYCLQLKKDGYGYVLAKDLDGTVHLRSSNIGAKTGRLVDKIDLVPHIAAWAMHDFPNGTQICLEVCYGRTSKDVNAIMLCKRDSAIRRQELNGWVQGWIYDILFWGGKPVHEEDFAERWALIEKIAESGLPEFIHLVPTVYEDKGETLSQWLADGEEGGVFKALHSTREIRAHHWVRHWDAKSAARPPKVAVKVKQQATHDFILLGVVAPEKEYKGGHKATWKYRDENDDPVSRLWALDMAGAIEIGVYSEVSGTVVPVGTVSSGLDDELRQDLFANEEQYIGRVVEIGCMAIDNRTLAMRHPRFLRFRDDKDPSECDGRDANWQEPLTIEESIEGAARAQQIADERRARTLERRKQNINEIRTNYSPEAIKARHLGRQEREKEERRQRIINGPSKPSETLSEERS